MASANELTLRLLHIVDSTKQLGVAHENALAAVIPHLLAGDLHALHHRLTAALHRCSNGGGVLLHQLFDRAVKHDTWAAARQRVGLGDVARLVYALEDEELVTGVADGSRWKRFVLHGARGGYGRAPRHYLRDELVHVVVYERVDLNDSLEERDFRVWSQNYLDDGRWSYSEAWVEEDGRRLLLEVEIGYRLEFPRVPTLNGHWGRAFRLMSQTVLEINAIDFLLEEKAIREAFGVPDFLR